MDSPSKTWVKTRYQNLYRHAGGVYYARLRVNGKPTWRSLHTEVLSVAREELSKLLKSDRENVELNVSRQQSVKAMTLGEVLAARQKLVENTVSIKKSTKKYWREIHDAILRSWPEAVDTDIRKITKEACIAWSATQAAKFSPTRFNNALGALKNAFEYAIEKGLRVANPVKGIKRVKAKGKDLTMLLPEPEVFAHWVETIRKSPSRWGVDTADFVELVAFSGARPLSEACNITWRHCDFGRNELVILGEPEEGTKTRSVRRIPMNSSLRALLEKMRQARPDEPLDTPVLRVKSAAESMRRAAKLVGMGSITQYDLRHLFTTRCIESGVDIPTVAKWLGHKDGGALLLRTYNHTRDVHSHASAAKVSF